MTTGSCHRKCLKYLDSHFLISPFSFCPCTICPLPCRRTRQRWLYVRLSVEMFCTDFCHTCLCLLSRYEGDIYLYASCIYRQSPHVGSLKFAYFSHHNRSLEPSGVAAKIWEGRSWKLSCTVQPCIRRLWGKFGKLWRWNIFTLKKKKKEHINKYNPPCRNWLRNWKKLRKAKGFYRKTVRRTKRFWQRRWGSLGLVLPSL